MLKRSLIAFAIILLSTGVAGTVAAQQNEQKAKGPPADRAPRLFDAPATYPFTRPLGHMESG